MPTELDSFRDALIARRVVGKTASWWDFGPMDGDGPSDLLHEVSRLDPRKAANLVEKHLKSSDFPDRYAAMGVWDVVMSSNVQLYKDVFSFLNIDVANAARKGIPRGDDWEHETSVHRFLSVYKRGDATGKIRAKFVPRGGHVGHVFYITDVRVGESLDIRVEMTNQFTDESEWVEETLNPPSDGVDFERVEFEEYGGKGQKQQSIVIKGETYEGVEYEIQVEMNANDGTFKDSRTWGDWEQS